MIAVAIQLHKVTEYFRVGTALILRTLMSYLVRSCLQQMPSPKSLYLVSGSVTLDHNIHTCYFTGLYSPADSF